jgi:hypothetical protein
MGGFWVGGDDLLDFLWVGFEVVAQRGEDVGVIILVMECVFFEQFFGHHHRGQGCLWRDSKRVDKPAGGFGFLDSGNVERIGFGMCGETEVIVENGFPE